MTWRENDRLSELKWGEDKHMPQKYTTKRRAENTDQNFERKKRKEQTGDFKEILCQPYTQWRLLKFKLCQHLSRSKIKVSMEEIELVTTVVLPERIYLNSFINWLNTFAYWTNP